MKIQFSPSSIRIALASLIMGLSLATGAPATESKGAMPEKEQQLLSVLKTNSSPDEKALACKKLAVYGTKESVPALAALLSDERLASWARIPLEAIPGSEPDKALRDAVPKLKGKLLVGVINSMGVRRDEKAVKLLVKKLDDQDALVASAAAESLGRIGGSGAAKALKAHLTASVPAVRSASAEGCVECGTIHEGGKAFDGSGLV